MKILLTAAPFWNEPDTPAPRHIRSCAPMAPYLLAAILNENGHDADVFDPHTLDSMIDGEFRKDWGHPCKTRGLNPLSENVSEFSKSGDVPDFLKYDVVGISSTSGAWPNARKILEFFPNLKDRPGIVLGGPHPTAFPEHVLKTTAADYIVMGEGDETIVELIAALNDGKPVDNVEGIAWKNGDDVVINNPREPLSPEKLNILPVPTFDGLPKGYYDVIPVETSRGCPHQCVFCSVKFGRGIREMSPGAAADRVTAAASRLHLAGKGALFSVDDCFTAGIDRVRAVAEVVADGKVSMALEARVADLLVDEIFEAIERINPAKIEIGVEAGYPEGLKRIGKGITVEQIESCARKLSRAGLAGRTRFSFVMALPWEGRREVTETMKFAAKLATESGGHIQLNWFTCYPRSPIHSDAAKWGIDVRPEDYDNPFWWKDPDIFRRTHPKLTEKEALDTLDYLNLLKSAHPAVVFEGLVGQ